MVTDQYDKTKLPKVLRYLIEAEKTRGNRNTLDTDTIINAEKGNPTETELSTHPQPISFSANHHKTPGHKPTLDDITPDNPENNPTYRFPNRKSVLGESDYHEFVVWVLQTFNPKTCTCGELCTKEIPSRPSRIRCPKCHKDYSRTAYTPLHHFKLPLWMFGYCLYESLVRYPGVLSGQEIVRRLGINRNSAG